LQWCWQLVLNIPHNFPSIKVIPMTLPVNKPLSTNDAELLTRIGIALQLLHPSANRVIHPSIEHGVVTLTGQVPTYYDRQLAFHIVRRVAGVRLVRDELNVAANSFNAWEQPVAKDAPPASTQTIEPTLLLSRWCRLWPTFKRSAALAVLLLTVIGCGESGPERVTVYPAKGQITFQGKPIPGAMVTLNPQTQPAVEFPTPRASVDADGTFKVSTFAGGDGAPEGKYTVTVQWYKPIKKGPDVTAGPNVIPPKYGKADSSPLVVEIAAQPTELPPIKL
jgi:hypothetical protein